LIDRNRELSISTANQFQVAIENMILFPTFYVSEVRRDEKTGELSITAYDAIYKADKHTYSEIELSSYTLEELATACAALLGVSMEATGLDVFTTSYPTGGNFEGTETIRYVLNAIAEATQTIYFINSANQLVFRLLDRDGAANYTIDKEQYITLDSKTNRRLGKISSITELGNNLEVSTAASGSTQYIRDNPLYELRDDVATLLDNALLAIGGITINQFTMDWRGNALLEVGDKIGLVNKDNSICYSYLLDDILTYDGSLKQKSQWTYKENETETAANPTSIGAAINQTYAKVDKVNKEITLVASEVNNNSSAISSIKMNTDSINATVESVRQTTQEAFEDVNSNIGELTTRVNAQITAEDVSFSIQSALANGVSKVETETGYVFDSDGLTVSKSTSDISTQITEDGMRVSKSNEVVLTANNVGVEARNLHATTYLIVGTNSRFEDYGSNRTGCFWIGS
jgi:hypothetical protein